MSADFWAGYISGAAGILIGNPLDLIKVRLQASPSIPLTTTAHPPIPTTPQFTTASSLIRGVTAPILGYGALNALLFVTYNRSTTFLNTSPTLPPTLWTTWLAGALGGLATWVISTPTELIKCRTQLSSPSSPTTHTSLTITKHILRTEGLRGLYFGGVVTALRDSIGYGFYFWSYELSTRLLISKLQDKNTNMKPTTTSSQIEEAAKVLLCGGIAGVITWASIFPLDVIKTRVQAQTHFQPSQSPETGPLLGSCSSSVRNEGRKLGAIQIARNAWRNEGAGVFFRGLGVCSLRAFMVNAVQWAVYEAVMRELDSERRIGMGSGNGKEDGGVL